MNLSEDGLHQDFGPDPGPGRLVVSPEESGQKLLHYLARRLETPESVLHRWIRTGQVRRNGKRTQPFARLNLGDVVRVPPFAAQDVKDPPKTEAGDGTLLPRPDIVLQTSEVLVCCKPAGLPVHGGTGHDDSLTARLHAHCADGNFLPTPAHRLDLPTSGLLLAARTYAALRVLHEAMIARDILKKTYLAWVAGTCCWRGSRLFEDGIVKVEDARGVERMALVPLASANKKASLTAECLQRREEASLLRLTLHTGRTHQIRAQLSGRGHPIIGDRKYGGPSCDQGLLLHAAHLSFAPALAEALRLPEREIFCPAPWLEPWNVD